VEDVGLAITVAAALSNPGLARSTGKEQQERGHVEITDDMKNHVASLAHAVRKATPSTPLEQRYQDAAKSLGANPTLVASAHSELRDNPDRLNAAIVWCAQLNAALLVRAGESFNTIKVREIINEPTGSTTEPLEVERLRQDLGKLIETLTGRMCKVEEDVAAMKCVDTPVKSVEHKNASDKGSK